MTEEEVKELAFKINTKFHSMNQDDRKKVMELVNHEFCWICYGSDMPCYCDPAYDD